MQKFIEVKNLSKSYENGPLEPVLKNINLDILQGDFVSIMGPSGSGKSTLLMAISGMDEFQEGEVLFLGKNLSHLKEDELSDLRRKEMGFVFQNPAMLPNLDLLDNILLPTYGDLKGYREEAIKQAQELMDSVGIGALADRSIKEVSGGQLQRASICRSIFHKPKILFGDEPTGALNSQASEEIMDLFSSLNQTGMTILLVTHDAKVAAKTKKVLFMKDGMIDSQLDLSSDNRENSYERVSAKMLELEI